MKSFKFLLIISALFVTLFLSGCESNDNPTSSSYIPKPVNRKVLMEFFSNSSCIPCVQPHNSFIRPLVDELGVTINDSSVILLSFQFKYPNTQDSIYWANEPENQARAGYYNVPAAPAGYIDGTYMGAFSSIEWPAEVNAEMMSTRYLTITLTNTYDSLGRSGNVTASVLTQTAPQTSDNVIHVILVENNVPYISAPNGIKSYEYVMRDMLTDSTGASISLPQGQTVTFPQSYTISTRFVDTECYIIVFVQSTSTKKVYGVERIKVRS